MRPVVTLVVAGAALTAAAFGAYSGHIVFTSTRDGKTEVYMVEPDGANPQRLTNNKNDDEQPALSPDGKMVAFVSNRDGNYEIYALTLGGMKVQRITATAYPEADPSFSADGKWIIYTSQAEGDRDIWRYNLASGKAEKYLAGDGDQYLAREAADGTLAYVQDMGGDEEIMIRESGKQPRPLSPSPNIDTMPSFSPDGATIYFVSNRKGDYDVYAVNRDGSGLKAVVSTPDLEGKPAPAADGAYLCVPSDADGDLDLYIYAVDGEKLGQLTSNTGYDDYEPFWGP